MGNDIQANKLTNTDIEYIADQVYMPLDEVKKAYNDFEQMCLIQQLDSEITYVQFETYFKKKYPNRSKKFISYLFKAFDRNDNDKLSFIEFLIGMNFFTGDDHYNNLKVLFNLFDLNKDHLVQKNEIQTILSSLKRLDVLKDEDEFLAKLDLNHDGSIGEDEFIYGVIRLQKYQDMFYLGEE
jgi:Ca2+-binding EF-hand superfamily protein